MFQFVTDKVCMKVAMSHRRFWCATPADRSVASFRRSVALRLIMSVAQDKTMCETPSVAVVIIDAGSLFAVGLDLEIAAILVSKN